MSNTKNRVSTVFGGHAIPLRRTRFKGGGSHYSDLSGDDLKQPVLLEEFGLLLSFCPTFALGKRHDPVLFIKPPWLCLA